MGHRGRARQLIFGDDHVGGAALEPRQHLERIGPGLLLAQIDAGDVFGARPQPSTGTSMLRPPSRVCGSSGVVPGE